MDRNKVVATYCIFVPEEIVLLPAPFQWDYALERSFPCP
jgi:hypothetical protein